MTMGHSEIIFAMVLAVLLGGVVGYQRQQRGKAAGIRTHALVTLGSTLFTILSRFGFGFETGTDPSRVAAQIVVGIGFLGAGMILHQKDRVVGLTTAAGLWAAAALGMTIGVGWYRIAGIATLFMLAILLLNDRWARHDPEK